VGKFPKYSAIRAPALVGGLPEFKPIIRSYASKVIIRYGRAAPTLAEGEERPQEGYVDQREANSLLSGWFVGRMTRALLRTLWTAIRLPLLTLFVILEPVVRVLLAGLALLLVLAALVLECTAPATLHVPFWGMLAVGIGCAWLLALYRCVLRILSL
jgi:hypothetical protein